MIEDCADDPPIEQPEAFVRALGRPRRCASAWTGRCSLPGGAGFERGDELWNAMIAKTPALVVQPTGTDDVVAAVEYAREHGLPLSVRGGGHNIAGTALADGGLTIDMSRLREVVVDPAARTATVAARLPARRRRPRDAAPRAGHAARVLLRGRRGRA